jgi:hypothetical protein
MAFHENFWIVTGTAAPVIALSCIVLNNDLTSTFVDALRIRSGFGPDAQLTELAIGGTAQFVYFVNGLNLTVQSGVFVMSLSSLLYQRNYIAPTLALWGAALGITGLLVAVVGNGRRRILLAKFEFRDHPRRPRNSKRQSRRPT